MIKISFNEKWQKWLEYPFSNTGIKSFTFPVYLSTQDSWMVFDPNSDDYMLVPHNLYMNFYNKKFYNKYQV